MDTAENKTTKQPKKRRHLFVLVGIIMLLTGVTAFFAVGYFQSHYALAKLQQTVAKSSENEAADLIKKIGSHMTLPDEKPTIATVEDTKKLADQAFFKNSQNGDKVLMYTQAKKAILYRPSQDKIIEVAYLNIKKDAK